MEYWKHHCDVGSNCRTFANNTVRDCWHVNIRVVGVHFILSCKWFSCSPLLHCHLLWQETILVIFCLEPNAHLEINGDSNIKLYPKYYYCWFKLWSSGVCITILSLHKLSTLVSFHILHAKSFILCACVRPVIDCQPVHSLPLLSHFAAKINSSSTAITGRTKTSKENESQEIFFGFENNTWQRLLKNIQLSTTHVIFLHIWI